jgi:hypothetical protein
MALTIKNLGRGTLAATPTMTTIVTEVTTGKSVLVDNLILMNKGAGTETIVLEIVRASPSKTVRILSQSAPTNTRIVVESLTLNAGDKIQGTTTSTSSVDFLASGAEKDL